MQVANLSDQEHHYLVHWLKKVPKKTFSGIIKRLHNFVTCRLFPEAGEVQLNCGRLVDGFFFWFKFCRSISLSICPSMKLGHHLFDSLFSSWYSGLAVRVQDFLVDSFRGQSDRASQRRQQSRRQTRRRLQGILQLGHRSHG